MSIYTIKVTTSFTSLLERQVPSHSLTSTGTSTL